MDLQKIEKIIEPVLKNFSCELYDLKLRKEQGLVLVIMIDHLDGVTLDLCEKVSREISIVMDVEDAIQQKYSLEVSSPGIYRDLKNEKDYQRFQGDPVKITFFASKEKGKQSLEGDLVGFDKDSVFIQPIQKEQFNIKREDVVSIHLNPSF